MFVYSLIYFVHKNYFSTKIKIKAGRDSFYAKCLQCKARGPKTDYNEMAAVKEWNTRKAL